MRPLLLDVYRITGFFLYPLARCAAPLIRFLPGRAAYCYCQRLGLYDAQAISRAAGHVPEHRSTPSTLENPAIWVHAASMGEVQAAILLVTGLRKKFAEYRYVITSTTKQGHELALSRLPQDILCLLAPLDMPQAVRRALKAIRPALYICLETELWPLLLTTLHARQVPMLLLNGRMSARSLRRYTKLRATIAAILQGFSRLALISPQDQARFAELGVAPERMEVAGNIKFDLPFASEKAAAIRAAHRTRLGLAEHERLLICGSIHGGEEELLLPVFLELAKTMPLVLVLAPRHQERLAEVESLLQNQGIAYERYSRLQGRRTAQVVLVDTMGDLADLYSAGDSIFCGGSLLPRLSGHNVMEAARWGRPVYFGPHMKDWQEAADLLCQAGGGFEVEDSQALISLIRHHAASASAYQDACQAARDCAASQRGALARQMALVEEYL